MKLDVQLINHNYITRMVIFSIFLFKEYRNRESLYTQTINGFLKRKIGYSIDLSVECGPKITIDEKRDLLLENILNDENNDYMNLVVVSFKTALKEVNMQIDLNKEHNYEDYLYQ